jgi:hypothetical protein
METRCNFPSLTDRTVRPRAGSLRVQSWQGCCGCAAIRTTKKESEQRICHDQSTGWALAFNLCPVGIWRGDFDSFERFVGILLEHSQKVFCASSRMGYALPAAFQEACYCALMRTRFFETEDGRRESEVGRPLVGKVA